MSQDIYEILSKTQRQRVSDGAIASIFDHCPSTSRKLILVLPQLGDFDSLEYIWWIQREIDRIKAEGIAVRAVGIGDRQSGEYFCKFTGFDPSWMFMDHTGELHRQLKLYAGLTTKFPLLSSGQSAWVNLMLMCAGIGSQGTLREVFRGYKGDRHAPQLIADEEVIKASPLPPLKGSFFKWAGGSGFQRPFELATLRLRNMTEVLGNWNGYVPDASYMTQRGATFLFDAEGKLIYEHRDRGILGFAANPSYPLTFLFQKESLTTSR
ncbi:AhpC/TSA family protein [Pseudanabaena sp. FACHB-1998]|uniref:peroxiredoxin-like family protein n=1 Tax=Pseudanabaena sp. FACHB-1998 TaxID=2692858 RepID=UPI00168185B6|nr:peroxiredoxin-like family protein [Pseudanabaena sp. FACHB-1998]MBD2178247.1 AhpC/TSA family protein [Pseudanabaena sp. FACHB-1998]